MFPGHAMSSCHHAMLQDDKAIGRHFPHPVHGETTLLLRLQDCVNYLPKIWKYENDFNNSIKVMKNDTKPNERNFFNGIEATRVM